MTRHNFPKNVRETLSTKTVWRPRSLNLERVNPCLYHHLHWELLVNLLPIIRIIFVTQLLLLQHIYLMFVEYLQCSVLSVDHVYRAKILINDQHSVMENVLEWSYGCIWYDLSFGHPKVLVKVDKNWFVSSYKRNGFDPFATETKKHGPALPLEIHWELVMEVVKVDPPSSQLVVLYTVLYLCLF